MAEKLGMGIPGIPHSSDRSFLMNKSSEEGGSNLLQSQAELAETLRSREIESIETTELTALKLLYDHEKSEGSRDEENAINWPITTHLQQMKLQEANMKISPVVLEKYAHAEKVEGKPGWYTKVPPTYGFDSQTVRIIDEMDGKQIKSMHYEDRVRIGTKEERSARVERIEKFTREVFARMKFSGLYGHVFKPAIESIANLTTLYLASRDVKREDLRALLTLPADPEDIDTNLVNASGVEYNQEDALGRMIVDSMIIFNAVGLSEKPELFKQFVSEKAFQERILNMKAAQVPSPPSVPGIPPPLIHQTSLGEILKNETFKTWFGNPDTWEEEVRNDGEWSNKDVSKLRTDKTWIKEAEEKKRVGLTEKGNIFVREESFEMPIEFRQKVIEFLGDSETSKLAVDLAWKYFRLFAAADTVGCEWYYKPEDGTIHASIPLGSDYTSDFGKMVHPDAYLEFYHKNSRGAVPRGEYGQIKPFATDVLRAMNFGENYELPDGTVLPDRTSLYDLLMKHGVNPKNINYNKLPDRAIIGPYLRFFMAACGSEYGGGAFDIMTDKITSPDPYLQPAFWEKLRSKLHVGITKENVGWNKYLKSGGSEPYKPASSDEVKGYVLENIRIMLDGIFAEEVSRSWDNEKTRERRGRSAADKLPGDSPQEDAIYGITERIIATANSAIGGLNYTLSRAEQIRRNNLKNPSQSIYK